MTIAEINADLIKRNSAFRAFDVSQIEGMRNAIPEYAGRAHAAERKLMDNQKKIDRITALIEKFRADGRYDVSDAIRKALMDAP